MDTNAFIVTILGTSSITWLIQFIVTRHFALKDEEKKKDSVERKTLGAISYAMVSNEIDKLIDKGFATSEERRALEVLYDAYKANGWNGDMSARMEVVHRIPFREEDVEC